MKEPHEHRQHPRSENPSVPPVDAVAAGEEIIIAKAGKPIAKLVPIEKPKRKPGALKGTFIIDDAFFEPLPDDVLDVMETGYEHDPLEVPDEPPFQYPRPHLVGGR